MTEARLMEMKWYNSDALSRTSAADLWGIWAVINDLYTHHPERFGSEEIRAALKRDLDEYLGNNHNRHNILEPELYKFFVERLKYYDIDPFSNISLAFLSPADNIRIAEPMLVRFKEFRNIPYLGLEGTTYIDNDSRKAIDCRIEEIPKFDYVLTGNVINDPWSHHTQVDTVLACGMITKKSGRIVHILSYGEDWRTGNVDNTTLHQLAGQKLICCDPPGRYVHNHLAGDPTQMIVMEQEEEVHHTKSSIGLYYDYRHARDEWLMDSKIQTRSGDVSFTLKEYFDHFLNDREALKHLDRLGFRGVSAMAHNCFADAGWQHLINAVSHTGYKLSDEVSLCKKGDEPWRLLVRKQSPSSDQ